MLGRAYTHLRGRQGHPLMVFLMGERKAPGTKEATELTECHAFVTKEKHRASISNGNDATKVRDRHQ